MYQFQKEERGTGKEESAEENRWRKDRNRTGQARQRRMRREPRGEEGLIWYMLIHMYLSILGTSRDISFTPPSSLNTKMLAPNCALPEP